MDVESQQTINEAIDRLASRLDALEAKMVKDLDNLLTGLLTDLKGLTLTVKIN